MKDSNSMRRATPRHPLLILADRARMTEAEMMLWLLREGYISTEIGECDGPMKAEMVPKCDVARIWAAAEASAARQRKSG